MLFEVCCGYLEVDLVVEFEIVGMNGGCGNGEHLFFCLERRM